MDETEDSSESPASEHMKMLYAMFEQLKLPKDVVFNLSFAGSFADAFYVYIHQHRVQLTRGSAVLPDDAVVTLLLSY